MDTSLQNLYAFITLHNYQKILFINFNTTNGEAIGNRYTIGDNCTFVYESYAYNETNIYLSIVCNSINYIVVYDTSLNGFSFYRVNSGYNIHSLQYQNNSNRLVLAGLYLNTTQYNYISETPLNNINFQRTVLNER